MKKNIYLMVVSFMVTTIACTSNGNTQQEPVTTSAETENTGKNQDDSLAIKITGARFKDLAPEMVLEIKGLVQHYLEIKNFLVVADEEKAAKAAAQMLLALNKFDTSKLTAAQQERYDAVVHNLIDQTEAISKHKIEDQRAHFALLGTGISTLVKDFGAGMVVYQDHCPMYKEGSTWLSESKDIRNPFFGADMRTCGTVETMLQ